MVNPVVPAIESYLAIFNAIPFSVRALSYLVLGFMFLVALRRLFF